MKLMIPPKPAYIWGPSEAVGPNFIFPLIVTLAPLKALTPASSLPLFEMVEKPFKRLMPLPIPEKRSPEVRVNDAICRCCGIPDKNDRAAHGWNVGGNGA